MLSRINILAVLTAAIASVIGSVIWYSIFGDTVARLQTEWRGAPSQLEPWHPLVFLGTTLIIAVAVAILIDLTRVSGWPRALGLGLLLWTGFVATQWISSLVGESTPLPLAAIHAGDWLLHLVIISLIVGAWQTRGAQRETS